MKTITLEVFSDYTCPWCYVGWARLDKALHNVPAGVTIDIVWRPFEIHPEVPLEGMPVEDLPYPPRQWAAMQESLRQHAEAEGLEVGKRPKVSNTHRALMAGAWAQAEHGSEYPAFHEALFAGYFAEGRDLGDPAELRTLAERVGLDPDAMDASLESGAWEDALVETSLRAGRFGISGTPTFLFEERFVASGAIPTEALIGAFQEIAAMAAGGGKGRGA